MESSETGLGPARGKIRHRETQQFYKGQGQWAGDSNDAMLFEGVTDAAHEAQRAGLKGPCEYVVEVGGQIGFRMLLP